MIIRRGKNQRGGCQLQSGKEFKQLVPLGKCPWVDRFICRRGYQREGLIYQRLECWGPWACLWNKFPERQLPEGQARDLDRWDLLKSWFCRCFQEQMWLNCHVLGSCWAIPLAYAFSAAAAAAKLLQSCLILCDPIYSSPPGSTIPGILQARTLEWVAISFSNAGK